MSPRRRALGSWRCRSGNSVDVFLQCSRDSDEYSLALEWDAPPPLSVADALDYVSRIQPAILARVREVLEAHVPTAVVTVTL